MLAHREHKFHMGHRVYGHEGKCVHLHGHEYTVTFFVESNQLDSVGRVIDFSVIKSRLCDWVDENLDHKMMLWDCDPFVSAIKAIDPDGIFLVAFNPTAELIAKFFLDWVGPMQLQNFGVRLVKVVLMETSKCGVCVEL